MRHLLTVVFWPLKPFYPNIPKTYGPSIMRFWYDKFLIIIGFLIFVYDCLYNNFVLLITMYYLPIYFLGSLWQRYEKFIRNIDHQFTHILYEMHYSYPYVIYINIRPFHHEHLLNSFKNLLHTRPNLEKFHAQYDVHSLQLVYRFQRIGNTHFYSNDIIGMIIHRSQLRYNGQGYWMPGFEKKLKGMYFRHYWPWDLQYN
jgi:hypothetical protein